MSCFLGSQPTGGVGSQSRFRKQLISDYYKYWTPEKNTRFRYSTEVTPDTQLVFDIPVHRLLDRLVK